MDERHIVKDDVSDIRQAHESLAAWCRARSYAGHDPFDGLNSRLFQSTPLKHSRLMRLAWTQFFKRSPVNLRFLAGVPVQRNSKGTALFALAALADFRRHGTKESEREARALLDDLLAARVEGRW
ncbi:MAG: aspartate-semialdehyde dehydrogenase, partial [Pyrinomonadaceae bacterium]